MINNKYIIIDKIGIGSFGSIYRGQNIRTKEYVAIKVESINEELKMLKNETKIYKYLEGSQFISQIKWFGKDVNNYYMVIDLLGYSLKDIINKQKTFSLALTLKIGIKLINIIKFIHDKGLVHRDIKPDNFLFRINSMDKLFIIDFGLCKTYLDNNGQHIREKKMSALIGSINYASINSHLTNELSRRDDLESIFYMLYYFYVGFLPWSNLTDTNQIIELKRNILNSVSLPKVLLDFIKYIREIKFNEKPNYYLFIDNFSNEIKYLNEIKYINK